MDIDFRINEVAKLLGISTEAIRFYESKGVVTPRRNVENNYRSYSYYDLYRLFVCKYWQFYGFPIGEITSLVGKVQLDELAPLLDLKKKDFLKQISDIQYAIDIMEKIKDDHVRILTGSDKYKICASPQWLACWLIDGGYLNMEVVNLPFYKKVISNLCMFSMAMSIPQTQNTDDLAKESKFGFLIERHKADYLGLSSEENINILKPVSCVNTIIDTNPTNPESYIEIRKWMDEHRFALQGDIICRSIGTLMSEGIARYEVWLPIVLE